MWSNFPTSSICGLLKWKSLWSFAHIVRWDQVSRARNADQAVRTYKCFVYSIVTIMMMIINLYSTNSMWHVHLCILGLECMRLNWKYWRLQGGDFFGEIHKVRKGVYMWAFFFIVLFGYWLAELSRETPITWYVQQYLWTVPGAFVP